MSRPLPFLSFASKNTFPCRFDEQVVDVPATTSQEEIAESLRLNPQDRISDCIDEQIVPAPLIQDENIEMNLEENDELVQPFLRKCSSEDITVSPPSARLKKKRRRKRMAQGSCSARSDLSPLTVVWEAQHALMLCKVGKLRD